MELPTSRRTFLASLALFAIPLAMSGCTSSDVVGVQDPEVVNAAPVPITRVPWQISLYSSSFTSSRRICGGVVLAPQWILTAHHCLAGAISTLGYEVIAGTDDLRGLPYRLPEGAQRRSVDRAFPYGLPSVPSPVVKVADATFDRTRDIELIHLAEPLDLDGPRVKAIPLVDDVGLTSSGTEAFVSGFSAGEKGSGPTLTGGATMIIDNDEAEERFYRFASEVARKKGEPAPDRSEVALYDVELATVTSGEATAKICYGDSGGPLVVRAPDGSEALAGVVSWGVGACSSPESANAYARVSSFAPWIRETMAVYDAAITRIEARSPAMGTAAARALDTDTACRLAEVSLLTKGYQDVRGHELDLDAFGCRGDVSLRETTSNGKTITSKATIGVTFATRGPSPRSFTLDACLVHPVDDASDWWVNGFGKDGDCFAGVW